MIKIFQLVACILLLSSCAYRLNPDSVKYKGEAEFTSDKTGEVILIENNPDDNLVGYGSMHGSGIPLTFKQPQTYSYNHGDQSNFVRVLNNELYRLNILQNTSDENKDIKIELYFSKTRSDTTLVELNVDLILHDANSNIKIKRSYRKTAVQLGGGIARLKRIASKRLLKEVILAIQEYLKTGTIIIEVEEDDDDDDDD